MSHVCQRDVPTKQPAETEMRGSSGKASCEQPEYAKSVGATVAPDTHTQESEERREIPVAGSAPIQRVR